MAATDQDITTEVEAACRRYLKDFPAAAWRCIQDGTPIDYDVISFWIFPIMFIMGDGKGGTSVSIVDQALFDSQICGLYQQYDAQGWGGDLRLDTSKISVVSADVALIETTGTRLHSDGSEFNRWDSCYCMKHTSAGWKQFAVIDPQAPRPPVQEWVRWLRASSS